MKITEKQKAILGILSLLVILVGLSVASFYAFHEKIFRARVLGVSVESLTTQQAQEKLSEQLRLPETINIEIDTGETTEEFSIKSAEIDAKIDYEKTVNEVYNYPRTGNFKDRGKKVLAAVFDPYETSPIIHYDQQKLEEYLSIIAGQVYVQPVYPDINSQNGVFLINKGSFGRELDINTLTEKIKSNLSTLSSEKVQVSTVKTGVELSESNVEDIRKKSEELRGKTITLVHENFEYELSDEQILELVYGINGTQLGPFESLLLDLGPNIEREAKNPVFKEQDGRVAEFVPSTTGVEIDKEKLRQDLNPQVLGEATQTEGTEPSQINVAVKTTQPEISTEDVNNYGIRELIGYGESYYRGSNAARIHNVALAASKFNGVLIPPGEVFSFNDTVGDISVYTGFKQSYVIQGNQTVLGDGGGVCQVSTTLFRTALDAGLQIVERRPHSYRVAYYEQGSRPGLDATIYSPTVDLKIKNDTPNHILIQTKVENNNKLIFEFYGTDDGREIQLTEPVISEIIPAPEDHFIDDPTKPAGYIEQIDYAANGAKVSFDYKVVKNGETLFEKTFYSNYRPWQAKFIRGTGETI